MMAKTTVTTKSTAKTPGKPVAAPKSGGGGRIPAAASRGSRIPTFIREVRVEMGKVTWPSRPDLIQATSVVLLAVVIAAIYIGLLDLVFNALVDLVRLG